MPFVAALLATLLGFSMFSWGEELTVVTTAKPQLRWAAGVGMEGRLQQDVNPSYPATRALPQLFAQIHWGYWSMALEGGFWEKNKSHSGAFSVESETSQISLWGRYSFKNEIHWSPFLTAGFGAYFDTIVSRYGSDSDTQVGRRDFVGTGGGLSHELWPHVQLEGELRMALIEDRKDITISGVFRLGFLF